NDMITLTLHHHPPPKQPALKYDNNFTALHVVNNACGKTNRIEAKREVIVSAGAINTPQLLMLSGIGPADHLAEVGIETRVDSPGVGEHLGDHPEAVISWEAKKPMVEDSTQWWEI